MVPMGVLYLTAVKNDMDTQMSLVIVVTSTYFCSSFWKPHIYARQ